MLIVISGIAAAHLDVVVHDPLALLEGQAVPLALLVEGIDEEVLAVGDADLRAGLGVRVGRGLRHRQVGVGGGRPAGEAALAEHDVEGVDVLEDRALAEQQQVGVAAGADRRIRSQRAVLGEVLAGGQELGLVGRPLLGDAPPPGGVELEERELDERAAGHETKVNGGRARGRGAVVRLRRRRRRAQLGPRRVTVCRCCRRTRRFGELAPRGPLPGLMSTGIGQVPAGADLSRHLAGKPGRRTRSTTGRCRRSRASSPVCRTGTQIVRTSRQRSGGDRPRAARVEPAGRRDPLEAAAAALSPPALDGGAPRRRCGASSNFGSLSVFPRGSAGSANR